MPVDHERRLIFVHIPKTGGTTILNLLGLWQARRAANLHTLFGEFGPFDLQHLTLPQLRQFLTDSEMNLYRKFAFVRNPWDRAVSAALWQTRFAELGVRDLRDHVDWAERVTRRGVRRPSDAHAVPQSAFVVSCEGTIEVDYVGRFEAYRTDLAAILGGYLNLPGDLPHKLRQARRGHYRDYYQGDLAARIGRLYAEDVARFGYCF